MTTIPRLYLDTNVMLDFIDGRKGFFQSASRIISMGDEGKIKLVVSPISFINVNYILRRTGTEGNLIDKLRKFNIVTEVCVIDQHVIEKALHSEFVDFEDATQYYCALNARCEYIITRDIKHFKKSEIPVMTPDEYLASINLI